MSIYISPKSLKILTNDKASLTNINKQNTKTKLYDNLNKLCIIIQNKLFDEYEKLVSNNNEIKKLNILFNIFKKIYESRDKKYPIHLEYFISNYILKFVGMLNKEEYEFIKNLLGNTEQISFTSVYDFFKHSNKIYEALSFIQIDNDITFLSPNIKKNKYIIIPSENDSDIKKMYFIKLLIIFKDFPIKLDELKIKFLKKILSNNTWDKFVKSYIQDQYIIYNDEIRLAITLGYLCYFDFNIFIEIIARQIIEEQNKNKTTTTLETIKNSKDILDLFEIFYSIANENIEIKKELKKRQIEFERIEQERIELERIEQERIEFERIEQERIKKSSNVLSSSEVPLSNSSTLNIEREYLGKILKKIENKVDLLREKCKLPNFNKNNNINKEIIRLLKKYIKTIENYTIDYVILYDNRKNQLSINIKENYCKDINAKITELNKCLEINGFIPFILFKTNSVLLSKGIVSTLPVEEVSSELRSTNSSEIIVQNISRESKLSGNPVVLKNNSPVNQKLSEPIFTSSSVNSSSGKSNSAITSSETVVTSQKTLNPTLVQSISQESKLLGKNSTVNPSSSSSTIISEITPTKEPLTQSEITSLFNDIKKDVDDYNKNNTLNKYVINQFTIKRKNEKNEKISILKNKILTLNQYNLLDLRFNYANGKCCFEYSMIKDKIDKINESIGKLNAKIYPGNRHNGKLRIPTIFFRSSIESKK